MWLVRNDTSVMTDDRHDTGTSAVTMFVHIPKTAGTTFNSVLSYQYGHRRSLWIPWDHVCVQDTLCRLGDEDRARLTLVRGHVPFGWHEHINRPVRYITMLRHPVDRVVSLYYYFKQGPDCHEHRLAKSCGSVEEFVASEATLQVDNDQVRRLSGRALGFGEVTSEALRAAITHVTHFACVGLTERFDESILLMARALDWWWPVFYLSSNITRKRPSLTEISSSTRSLIEKYNEHDLALYEHCVKQFEATLDTQGESMDYAKLRLQRRNRLASRLLPGPLRLMRGLRSAFSNTYQPA